jgi:lipopolysaccharide/colanic/teichoic acid biosynthesis glycosyltransferase
MTAKRAVDLAVSLVALIVLSPIIVACGAAVAAVDGRPVFFRQTRVGRWGRPFTILKLRTMEPRSGDSVTVADDPRVTSLGRLLRQTKLDELPQLWNVVRGDMSLVGPRPELPALAATVARSYRALARARPGVTDWASVIFRHEEDLLARHRTEPAFYQTRLLPRKVALARLYQRHQSILLDCRILVATVGAICGATRALPLLVGPRLFRRAWRGVEP